MLLVRCLTVVLIVLMELKFVQNARYYDVLHWY